MFQTRFSNYIPEFPIIFQDLIGSCLERLRVLVFDQTIKFTIITYLFYESQPVQASFQLYSMIPIKFQLYRETAANGPLMTSQSHTRYILFASGSDFTQTHVAGTQKLVCYVSMLCYEETQCWNRSPFLRRRLQISAWC